MLRTVKGVYRDGQVRLTEDPGVSGEAAVVVTFLESEMKAAYLKPVSARIMTSGILAVPGRRMSTEEDFQTAIYDTSRWDRD